MLDDLTGHTQHMSGRLGHDRGLKTGRVDGDDLTVDPATISHRYGTATILPQTDPSMVYALLTIAISAQANAGRYVPLNLCLVFDQSLSMRGEKMDRAKDAARYVIDQLGPQDTLGVVSFNDRATLVMAAEEVRDARELKNLVDTIQPRGGTELAAGIRMGLDELRQRAQQRNTVSALLLLTDGRTYGDENECMALAEQAQRQQIVITPLGVGDEWNEDLLEALAYRSGSHSEYIDQPAAIVTAFQRNIEALQSTYARNARLLVQAQEGVRLSQLHRTSPLIGRVEVLPGAGSDVQTFAIGSLHAGEEQEFLLELVVQNSQPGLIPLARLQLSHEMATGQGQERLAHDLSIPAAGAGAPTPLDPAVRTAVEKVVAFKLQQKAWQDLTAGNLVAATNRLRMVATRLIDAGEDELARTVRAEVEHLERTGHASPTGTKQIKYGTRGLGHTQTMRPRSGLLGRETSV
jgi:Ca-activated chloride channel family protein